ncbi:MAG TPA: hypothetical protein VEU08_23570 [Vicinamibacterales bacterium]|nr:hypothetical protein [Vicinamibacterales bacterium]
MKPLTLVTMIPIVLACAAVALSACSSSSTTGAVAVSGKPGYPVPLSEPKITLTAPAASHDYGPPPPNAGHVAPGTDAAVALAADAKAAEAAASGKSG